MVLECEKGRLSYYGEWSSIEVLVGNRESISIDQVSVGFVEYQNTGFLESKHDRVNT